MSSASWSAVEFIRRKRDGATLTAEEIGAFVHGIVDGSVSDAQIAAFAMAVYLREMTPEECLALTFAQRDSGAVLDWSMADLPGPLVDKHSTGGVGDLTSLILGPMVAACGAYVPMISGRGLGHTGGTLDKLAAIPGYDTAPSVERFRQAVRRAGVAIIGQTDSLAPADRRLYAVRDVTGTVESIALITASILSKKLAAGVNGLVMDVKVGSGAFMPTYARSAELARAIVTIGNGAGMPTAAVLTDMNQPLAPCAGNALEIGCAIDYLSGRSRPARLHEVTLALAARMLMLAGLAEDITMALARLQAVLDSGAAAERFARMVAALGGPNDLLEASGRYLPRAQAVVPVAAPRAGLVAQIDCRRLGLAVVALGGGRRQVDDPIDYSVGLTDLAQLGQRVETGEPIAFIHARDRWSALDVARDVQEAYTVHAEGAAVPPHVYEAFD